MPANNSYMALAEEDISGRLPVNEYSSSNPYMDLVEEDKININNGVQQSLKVAGGTTPQVAGEVQRLSKKTEMPVEAVKFEMDAARTRARQIEAEALKLTTYSPILARQLTDVSFAEIAQNSLPELSQTEKVIKWFSDIPSDIATGTREGILQNQQGNLKYKMMAGIATPEDIARVDEIETQLKGMKGTGGAWEEFSKMVGQNLDTAPEAIKTGLQFATVTGAATALSPAAPAAPAAAAMGFGMGVLHTMLHNTYRVEGGEVYEKLLKEGVPHKSAQWAGLGVGVVNAALEGAGLEVAAVALSPVKKLLAEVMTKKLAASLTQPTFGMAAKEFGKAYAIHGAGEVLTETLQEVSAIVGEDLARVYGADGLTAKMSTIEGREEIADRISGVIVQTAKAMSVGGAIGPSGAFAYRMYQMNQAQKQTQFLEAVTGIASNSEVRKLNPDKYEEFAHAQTVNTPAENVYIDGQTFANTLRQLGVTADEVSAIVPDIKQQLDDALKTEGDVIIPTSKYMARIAGTELGNGLMQHMRLDPEGLSAAEHKAMEQNKQDMMAEAQSIIAEKSATDQTFAKSAGQVEKTMFDQLVATSMPAADARANAQIVRDMYVVAASKMDIMPHDLYAQVPYQVRSGALEGQANQVQMFEQARKKAQLEINQTVDELVSAADSQSNWKDWYKQHQAALDKLFGSDSALFQKILSATSQAASVKANVGLALKAYDQYLSGAEFTGYLPAVIGNLNRIRADEALTGQKISQYGEANEGNVDAIAVDRHIAMLFFDTKSPSPAQVEIAKQRIREVAERLGWEPRQVQAALWAFNQVRLGADPNKVVSYDRVLEGKADLIAALRTRHGRGEGGGVQAGSEAVQRSETGFGTEPDGTVFHQQGVTVQEQAETTAKIEETRAIEATLEAEGATDVKPILADQLMEDKSIPTITIEDILGITMFPTIADRTAAGALFHGIDSSKLQLAIHLLGGPFFPLRETNVKANVIYANRGKSVMSQKNRRLKEGANYMLIVLGDVNMHQSNTTVANTFFATLEAYVRDGRISEENMQALTDMVRNSKTTAKKINAYMKAFPYIGNIQELDAYIHTLSFEARSRLLDLLGSKAALDAGAPSMKKILDATRQPELAGNRWGDGVVLVKLDPDKPFVNLGEEGTMAHPDFPLGMRGEVVGKLRTPLNYELLWQNWLDTFKNNKSDFFDIMTSPKMTSLATWSERAEAFKKFAANSKNNISPTVRKLVLDEIKAKSKVTKKKPEGINPAEYDAELVKEGVQEDGTIDMAAAKQAYLESTNARRAFEMAKPALTITPDLVERLKNIDVPNIDGQRQAQLAVDMALGQWGRSGIAVNKGGVSPQAFVDAVKNSDAVATLDEYAIDDVKQGIKEKTLRLFQLGDKTSGIWFALKKGNPATGYGLEIAGLSDKDVTLTAVINNEQGARGIAAPAVVLKAIEEGASVLDAFAVRSSKFPNGFLPELYSLFGFEVVGELPFDPQYYTAQKLADAEAFWSKGGWNKETDGYPPVVIMKWMGTDAERKGITERYLRGGIEGLLEGRTDANAQAAEAQFDVNNQPEAEQGGATSDTGRAGGDQGTRNRASLASRAQSIARSIGELSDLEAANLGISTADRDAVRNLLDSGTLYNQRGIEPAGISGEAAGNNGQFAQQTRGGFDPKSLTTLLYKKADFSTFMHETFHFGLEFYVRLAQMENGSQIIKSDLDAVFEWMGIAGETPEARLQTWLGMSLDEQRKHHEAFAYNGEIYLFEGKAPSIKLQDVFNKFFDIMRRIYVSIRDDLNALYRQENNEDLPILTEEIRGVMDRMLASENQIRQAETVRNMMPIFQTQEQSGMDANTWAAYQVMAKEAHDQSVQDMTTASLRQMRWLSNAKSRVLKEMQREVEDQRKEMRDVVAAEVEAQPVYQADQFIRRGELVLPEEATKEQRRFATETGMGSTKMSIEDLKAMYGEEGNAIWRNLPTGKYGLIGKEGLHPDLIANQFGFSSGDEMIRALLAAPPLKEAIDQATDQRMLETYGELQTDKQVDIAVERALHNEARSRFAAIELKALAKAVAPVRVMVLAAKQVALGILANKKILEIKPNQYSASEAKALRTAAAAMKKVDTQAAIKALQGRLLNNQLAAEGIKTNQEIAKALEFLKGTQTPAAKKRIGADNSDQIQTMLSRFGLAAKPQERTGGNVSLAEWMKQQEEAGKVPDIAPELLIETHTMPYQDMTVSEFRDLVSAIRQIAYMGRQEQMMLTSAKNITFKEARDETIASIIEHAGDRKVLARTPSTTMGKVAQSMKRFWAAHIKAASIAKILDGGKDAGPMWQYFIRPANERADMETKMRSEATEALAKILEPVFKQGKMSGSGTFFESINRSMNREQAMAVALNMGNEGNMQRLLSGEGWTLQQVMPIVQSLSSTDLRAVQQIWDYLETYRPQVAEKERRLYGKEPTWVEPKPISIMSSDGKQMDLKGGYYPIKYDPAASLGGEQMYDAEAAKRELQGAYTSATTKRSFTKSRVQEVLGRPLLYSLSGVFSGINDVIHDLAWHEWLIDVNRMLRSTKLDTAIRDHYGPEFKMQLKKWVKDVAEGERGVQNDGEIALSFLRKNISAAGLGFNLINALQQITGFNQSIVLIGYGNMAKGISRAAEKGAYENVNEMSEFMAARSRTQFRELNEIKNQVEGKSGVMSSMHESLYLLQSIMQRMVDVPTWYGGYEKAISEGHDEKTAIALADQVVINSQGSGLLKDLSQIQRGSAALKLFTVFHDYMNTMFNVATVKTMTEKNKAKLIHDYLMIFTVPVVLNYAMKNALVPSGGDDTPEKIAKELIAEQISYLMGSMIVVREFADAGKMVAGADAHGGRDYGGPAGLRLITNTYRLTKQSLQGTFDDAFRKALIDTIGTTFGLPAAQVNRSITGYKALKEGQTKNPAALLFGYEKPK